MYRFIGCRFKLLAKYTGKSFFYLKKKERTIEIKLKYTGKKYGRVQEIETKNGIRYPLAAIRAS